MGAVPQRWLAVFGDGAKGAGAVSWLSAKMSKQISKMGALDVIQKAADKGDPQAMTLMGVCMHIWTDTEPYTQSHRDRQRDADTDTQPQIQT